eukprot:720555_1
MAFLAQILFILFVIGCTLDGYTFCSKGPHGDYTCDHCTGQCNERKVKYGCANPVGNDGVHACYCNVGAYFINETGKCTGNGVNGCDTCNLPANHVTICPALKGINGTCAVAIITDPNMTKCQDCLNTGGLHNLHYACYEAKTKQCHVTENECHSHSPPCGNQPGYCPCPSGWETCYS